MRAYVKLAAIILVGVAIQFAINYRHSDTWEDAVFAVRCVYAANLGTERELDRVIEDGRIMLMRRAARGEYEYYAEHPMVTTRNAGVRSPRTGKPHLAEGTPPARAAAPVRPEGTPPASPVPTRAVARVE